MPAILSVVVFAAGCEEVEEPTPGQPLPGSPRVEYLRSLEAAGLATTAVALDWRRAGDESLEDPAPVEPPHREARYVAPEAPAAMAYRISARRGQRLEVGVRADAERPHRIFIDLFRVPDEGRLPVAVDAADDLVWALERVIDRDGEYVVRIQPELLRGGRYTVTLRLEGSLAFPVSGLDPAAILSGFGAPRDGGRRDHHGVDIFAPRGTPALAAAEGVISRVDTTARGGRVVWLRARGGPALYYAHLDEPLVRRGQSVSRGDTVGLIGNTGNAISTPPHLHFGIYQRGPVDPWPFLYRPAKEAPGVPAALEGLGRWVRVNGSGTILRDGPLERAAGRWQLPPGTLARLQGASGRWYVARLADGRKGYLPADAVTPADEPVTAARLPADAPLRARPAEDAVLVDSIPAAREVAVIGRHGAFLLVRDELGREGWLAEHLLRSGAPAAGQR